MKKITFLFFLLCVIAEHHAQEVSGYIFTESTEVYSAVTGTNSTAAGDDGAQNGISIGFPFTFGGIDYTTISISTNGWIRLGLNIGAESWVNNLANNAVRRPLIAAYWDDHNRHTGNIQYALSGVAPNQTLEIGWDNITISSGGGTSDTAFASFKMRLYEGTGQIDLIYGDTMNAPGATSASVGLNDVTSFLCVTPGSPATVSGTLTNNGIDSTAPLVGKKFTFVPQPQCSGTPVPGNTLSTLSSACSGVEFILSLENTFTDFGISYQWQSSQDGIDFVNIDGATSPTLLTSQTQTTFYQALVTCNVNTAASTPIQVTVIDPANCYCVPTYTNGMTDGDLISNVIIQGTTLSNNTGTLPVNPSYTYFTGAPNYTATLISGFTYSINVTIGTYQDQNVAVWIDYNDDTVFAPEERVGFSTDPIPSNGTGVFSITTTCDSPAGTHRMRVRDVWNIDASTIDPCENYGYGETEDYDVTIVPAVSCPEPSGLIAANVNPTNAQLIWETGCYQITWDLHLTLQGGGLPSGAPSNPNVTSPLVVAGLTPMTAYDFYVMANCGANGDSVWAGPFTFTTLSVAVANDDCENATVLIPGGNFNENAVVATNVGATNTIGQPNPTCGIFGFGGDVWFSIVVPGDGNVTIETQADPGSPVLDTALSVFTGTCGALITVNCNDDIGPTAFSQLSLTGLIPGSTIYARVWEYANDTYGSFRVAAWNTTLKAQSFDATNFDYYPNPVKDFLNLSYNQNISDVAVFNLLGQQIFIKQIDSNDAKIDLSPLAKGAYMVKVTSLNQSKTIKIIKE